MPTRKVGAGALAGALSVILVWAANTFAMPAETQITGEIASAITTVMTFVVGYVVLDAEPEPVA